MRQLMDGELPIGTYRNLLHGLQRLFVGFEVEHACFLTHAETCGWSYVSRSALLAGDVGNLDPSIATSIRPDPAVRSVAYGWGALYVVEGSTLGARLIAAQVRRSYPPDTPLRYFSFGAEDASRWRRFERVLEQALADPHTHADALAGARDTFDAFSITLERFAA